jgi:hypothetical protein
MHRAIELTFQASVIALSEPSIATNGKNTEHKQGALQEIFLDAINCARISL